MSEPDSSFDDLVVDPSILPGVWTNETRVRIGRHEFTIDFVRRVPDDPRRFLVARAVMSAAVAFDLRDQLDDAWRRYADWSMPKDVNDG
ncbi:MAG: DUF3467 domain-containing protein [Actinobacteria bacterium]|nr:DUF3467 domain-containing protein [Actinomycetota bacterium]